MLATIFIKDLEVPCRMGVSDAERAQTQQLVFNLECDVNIARASQSDAIEDTVDYRVLRDQILQMAASREFHLLETLATQAAERLLADARLQRVKITIEKPNRLPEARSVGVTFEKRRAA